LQRCDRLAAGLKRVEQGGIDAVLLDLGLPDSHGLATLRQLQARSPALPIVVLSGLDDHTLAESAVREGAQDYLAKGVVGTAGLLRALRYAVDRKTAEEALRQSEQRYKILLAAVTDYLYTVQVENGRAVATHHGEGCAAVTGYSPQEFAADPYLWYRMIHAEDRAAVMAQAAHVLQGKEALPLEHRIIHKNGSLRWIRNAIVVRRDGQGHIVSYDGLITNITDRKMVEEELRSSESLYQSLVESIPLHMFRKDMQGRFTFANQRFCDLLKKSLAMIIGKTDHDFFPAELADKYRRDDLKVMASGTLVEDTERHQLPSGEQRYVAVVKTPVYDAHRQVIGTQGMFWDVTASKWAEEQQAQLRVARTIQRQLLPKAAPKLAGFDIGGASYPAEACGGDYYDYIVHDKTVDIVIGDASGHGFGPALLAAVTHACLRTLALAHFDIDIAATLATANRLLLKDSGCEHFVTLLLARIDLQQRCLVYANAGHPAGYVLNASGQVKSRLMDTGPLLGVFVSGQFPAATAIVLETGDLIVFLSDGVLDVAPQKGTRFGPERTLAAVSAHRLESAQVIAEALCQAALAHHEGAPQQDDITVVIIKVL
jgi:sigma-B regulation protein RsbU (phosphoserine phosphatase)